MGKKLFVLFVIVPLLELYLLIQLGDICGFWPTLGLVVLTGALGAWLARLEGFRVLAQWQQALQAGRLPPDGVLGGVLLLVGAVLLIAPGLITDVVGLLLLLPQSRHVAALWLRPWVQRRIDAGSVRVVSHGPVDSAPDDDWTPAQMDDDFPVSNRTSSPPSNSSPQIIEAEGELVRMDDDESNER